MKGLEASVASDSIAGRGFGPDCRKIPLVGKGRGGKNKVWKIAKDPLVGAFEIWQIENRTAILSHFEAARARVFKPIPPIGPTLELENAGFHAAPEAGVAWKPGAP